MPLGGLVARVAGSPGSSWCVCATKARKMSGLALRVTRARDAHSMTINTTDSTCSFTDFGLAEPIVRAVSELGYREPTPIQAQAIPVVMSGRDVMGAAQTGTGKTAGFALPMLHRLLPWANTSASPARHPVRSLVLAPTRELADQIYQNVVAYARHTALRVAVVYGGVDIKPQMATLRQGCEVLIATPGRLLDHVEQRSVSLGQVSMLVLDEADRMLDMGFLPDIQRIINLLHPTRQNLMFSATFSGEIRKLAESFLKTPQLIEVARRNALAENITQKVYRVASAEHKRAAVGWLVREYGLTQVIVFSNTKLGAGRLARQLEQDGLNAAAIHGDKTQQERLKTLEEFKQGRLVVLVATDVAARGLDIAELPAVINADLPYAPEDYVHRIGRTGRAGASGMAWSLLCGVHDDRLWADIEKLTKRTLVVEDLAIELPVRPGRSTDRGFERSGDVEVPASERVPRHRARERDRERSRRVELALPEALRLVEDPFFSRPYEPSDAGGAASDSAPPQTRVMRPGGRAATRRLAVLLGGALPAARTVVSTVEASTTTSVDPGAAL
jgi:ATP-dependent RNA helicase RhlE